MINDAGVANALTVLKESLITAFRNARPSSGVFVVRGTVRSIVIELATNDLFCSLNAEGCLHAPVNEAVAPCSGVIHVGRLNLVHFVIVLGVVRGSAVRGLVIKVFKVSGCLLVVSDFSLSGCDQCVNSLFDRHARLLLFFFRCAVFVYGVLVNKLAAFKVSAPVSGVTDLIIGRLILLISRQRCHDGIQIVLAITPLKDSVARPTTTKMPDLTVHHLCLDVRSVIGSTIGDQLLHLLDEHVILDFVTDLGVDQSDNDILLGC